MILINILIVISPKHRVTVIVLVTKPLSVPRMACN